MWDSARCGRGRGRDALGAATWLPWITRPLPPAWSPMCGGRGRTLRLPAPRRVAGEGVARGRRGAGVHGGGSASSVWCDRS
jgi:hypothetical protein